MTQTELDEVLRKHKMWLDKAEGGERANMQGADMQDADMRGANMQGANMQYADMQGANIDYSCWPLWCGSLHACVDDRIAIQLLYHTLSVVQHSPYVSEELKRVLLTEDVVGIANRFHRVEDCGALQVYQGEYASSRSP